MKVTTDERLNAVLAELKVGDIVADIGCDHGKIANLAVEITKNNVYAVDISQASLIKAQKLSEELGVQDKVKCLVGDGVHPIEDYDVNTVVIAGMGGLEIIKILSEAKKRYAKYILVPHRNAPDVRHYLCDNDYFIRRDYFVKSAGKFYSVMVVVPDGKMNYTSYGYLFGLTRDKVEREYAEKRLAHLKDLAEKATGIRKQDILDEIKIIEHED